MKRNYKLAANFNVVEITIDAEDYDNYVSQLQLENENLIEMGLDPLCIDDEETWIVHILQREYDILSAIKIVDPLKTRLTENTINKKEIEKKDPPSKDQISYGLSLGIKDPENMSKSELRLAIKEALNKRNR